MKLRTLVKPLLVASLLVSASATASPSAQQVLAVSPVDDIVAQYPAMMSQGIRDGLKRSEQVPPMVAETIGYVVSSSFRAADIERRIVQDLEAGLNDRQLAAVAQWYESSVAEKIAAAEIVASDPATWKDIRAKSTELNRKYQGSERAALFDRFDRAARATESAVDTSIAVQLGLATAMAALSDDSVHHDQLKQRIESQRSAIRGIVEQQVYDSYLYAYEHIGLSEMKQYVSFLESDAGSAFSRVVTNSIQRAITDPIESVGRQMSRFLSPESASASGSQP